MTEKKIHFYTSPDYDETAEKFFSVYSIQKVVFCPNEKIKMVIPRKERICRFCKKKYPLVTFRNNAHIIPESLGNRYLTSEFECDDCNHKFGKLDDQLIKFIGVNRSLNGTVGKKKTKIPKYQSADNKVLIQNEQFFSDKNALKIELSEHGNGAFQYDEKNSLCTIKFLKTPYVPLSVFQSLLKIALSIMPEEEIVDYQRAIDFLHTSKKNTIYNTKGLLLSGYLLPLYFGYDQPFVFLFKKKNLNDNIPTHVVAMHCRNMMLEIKLPLNRNDKFNLTAETIIVRDCPPIFFKPYELHPTTFKHFRRDLSSPEIVRNDEEIVTFKFNFDSSKKITSYNPMTGSAQEEKTFNSNEIKGIWISNAQIETS